MAMLPLVAMAQTSFDDEVNAELDKLYTQKSAQSANVNALQGSAQTQSAPTQQVQTQLVQQQVIAAPQVQTQAAQAVQVQPTTMIEATPLMESRAELIRKARQDAELTTEQKIVEKLEQSRMEDEKRRADVLFGEKFNSMNNTAPAPVATPAQAPVVVTEQVMAPVVPTQVVTPVVVETEEKIDKETVRSEISAALSDLKKQDEKPKSKSYFSVLAGTGDYPDAVNVKGNYALGFSVGKQTSERMQMEGTFLYSNYQVEQKEAFYYNYDLYHRITEMDQYSIGMAAKYQLLDGAVHPVVGALMAYTYRSFTDSQFAIYADSSTSHALDLGLLTGLDVDMSESFSIGIDLRYMMNLTNKSDSGFQKSFVQPVLKSEQPIEKLNYYTFSIVGKSTF